MIVVHVIIGPSRVGWALVFTILAYSPRER